MISFSRGIGMLVRSYYAKVGVEEDYFLSFFMVFRKLKGMNLGYWIWGLVFLPITSTYLII